MANEPIDIIFGGAYSIKAYYEESGNPKQMRGASQLLSRVFDCDIKKLVERYLFDPEQKRFPYYTGGSQMFAVLKHEKGEIILPQIEDKIREVCQTARFSIIVKSACTDALEDKGKYKILMDQLFAESYERRMSYIPDFAQEDAKDDELLKSKDSKGYIFEALQTEGVAGVNGWEHCDRCCNRPAYYSVKIQGDGDVTLETLNMCTACAKKEKQGRLDSDERKVVAMKDRTIAWRDITHMSDLADGNGDVALIYADINNLGGIGTELDSYKKRYEFYNDIDNAVKLALEETKQVIGQPYQEIACGGDDVCMLTSGDKALLAAVKLASAFDRIWNASGNCHRDVRISVGATISDSKTAIDTFHHMTNQLLKSAKKRAYAEKSAGCPKSCVDVYRLGGDGQYSVDIGTLRNYGDPLHPLYTPDESVNLTLFPMTVKEGEAFLKVLDAARAVSSSRLRNIVNGSKHRSVQEGKLYFQYLCARH
ncbi:MAG: hypothetical protein LBK46_10855, partial [Oscillospiraceae bacterium]|nr:hypothetical protein [Oscillospiraceae bacterium]